MYKRGNRMAAGLLALVLAWNNLGMAENNVHAAGIADRSLSEVSRLSVADTQAAEQESTEHAEEEEGTLEAPTLDMAPAVTHPSEEGDTETEQETENIVSEEITDTEALSEERVEELTEEGLAEELPEEELLEEEAEELLEEELAVRLAGEAALPATLEEMKASTLKTFTIETYADVLNLCNYSKEPDFHGFKGYTFNFGLRDNQYYSWDFTNLSGFTGLGTKENPFQGKIEEYYANSVTFSMKRPLFEYLGSGAGLKNFNITLSNASSGIANYYVALNAEQVTYTNVVLNGSVYNGSNTEASYYGVAGAMYGTVMTTQSEQYTVVVDGSGLDLSGLTVSGIIAGGFIGCATGNVKIQVADAGNLAKKVTYVNSVNSQAAGGIVGKLEEGSVFEVTSAITVSNEVGQTGTTSSSAAVGGLIGWCKEATIISTQPVTKTSNILLYCTGRYAGGYVGYAENSKLEISRFQLNGYVRMMGYSQSKYCDVGGVIGRYAAEGNKSAEEAYLKLTKIGISKKAISAGDDGWVSGYNTYENNIGGIAGYMDASGGSVEITGISSEDESYAFLPSLQYDTYSSGDMSGVGSGAVGGIAGRVKGIHFAVSDVTLDFQSGYGLAGAYVGGIFGYVETQSRMKLTDIKIKNFYLNYASSRGYNQFNIGGLLGSVFAGSMVRLDGTIDLSGISYSAFGNWNSGIRGNRGYVAGSQLESVIYLEEGASLLHNTGFTPDANSTVWYENAIWESDRWTDSASAGSNVPAYVMDDIGTYGGVYRNIKDGETAVIRYDSMTVGGTVSKNGAAYRLKNEADALRLAIALGTFSSESASEYTLRFGTAACFGGSGITAASLLAADYEVEENLNLASAGIYSLSRNDNTKYTFSGTVKGTKSSGNPKISLAIVSRQNYGGLFPFVNGVSNPVTLSSLDLEGYICYNQEASGGFAAVAVGTLSLDHVNTAVKIRGCSYTYNFNYYYYGGIVGKYSVQNGGTFTYKNGTAAAQFANIRAHHTAGGLVGRMLTSNAAIAAGAADTVVLDSIVDKTVITTSTYFNTNMSWLVHAKTAGLIAYIAPYEMRQHMNDWTCLCAPQSVLDLNRTTAKIQLKDITVDGAGITVNSSYNTGNVRATGGLLGYEWDCSEIRVEGKLEVKDSHIKSRGHVGGLITTLGSSKFDLTAAGAQIDLQGLEMQSLTSDEPYCSFLISDGRYAWVNLRASAYSINPSGVTATNYYSGTFDEIVGVNLTLGNTWINYRYAGVHSDYTGGGILNIILPNFKPFTSASTTTADYQSYSNKVIKQGNRFTRYYYNLLDPVSSDNAQITVTELENYTSSTKIATAEISTPEQFMLWHVYSYGNKHVRRLMASCFQYSGGMPTNVEAWNLTVTGDLDLNGYSYYPTKTLGGSYHFENISLTLYSETIAELEKTKTASGFTAKTPNAQGAQHYMMHAALFFNSSDVKINTKSNGERESEYEFTLTLKGTVTSLSDTSASAAVFAGNCSDSTYLSNIVCDGVRIADYTDGAVGLLVARVPDGATLHLDGISSTDTYKTNWGQSANPNSRYAAAALIGTVGGSTAINVHVYFEHMKVGGAKDDSGTFAPGTVAASNYMFKFASFIYSYDSLDNSNKNKSFGLYTFTKDDFIENNVTFGSELSYGVGYANGVDTVDSDDLLTVIGNAKDKTYIPYVYQTKKILVNPRSGDLVTGCGTYEDPYVIDSKMQFIMLCAYLGSGSGDSIFNVINNGTPWKVNLVGGAERDKNRCPIYLEAPGSGSGGSSEPEAGHIYAEYGVTKSDAPPFPTQDALRQAYYYITNDLDFTVYQDINEYVIMSEFSGLGTTTFPFSGVIVGKTADESGKSVNPVITLPSSDNEWDNYGFIQYMKGAVVKDIDIRFSDGVITSIDTNGNETKTKEHFLKVKSGGSGGGVAAIVLGGDNIIDNVKVDAAFEVWDNTVMTGGYVGSVKAGSVIVRNLTQACIEGYSVGQGTATGSRTVITEGTDNYTKNGYRKNSQVIGWVKDGCVIYEDTASNETITKNDPVVLERNEMHFEKDKITLPLSYSFPMVNGERLEANCPVAENPLTDLTKQKIIVSGDTSTGFKIGIHNSEQLEIAALALNSGAFSISIGDRDTDHLYAYDYTAVCRKAQYNYVGCKDEKNASSHPSYDDFTSATTKDDGNGYYPYIYANYMDFSGITTSEASGEYTGTMVAGHSYLNWYRTDSGNNIGKALTTYELDQGTCYDLTGFKHSFRGFGELYGADNTTRYNAAKFRANFDGKGAEVILAMDRTWDPSVSTTGMFNDLTTYRQKVSDDDDGFWIQKLNIVNSTFDATAASGSVVGALAGNVKGRWKFENVHLLRKGVEKEVTETVTDESGVEKTETKTVTEYPECKVEGVTSTGGLIGRIQYYTTGNDASTGNNQSIRLTECGVKGVDSDKAVSGEKVHLCEVTSSSYLGGLVGNVQGLTSGNHTHFGTILFEDCEVWDTSIMLGEGTSNRLVGGFIGKVGENEKSDSVDNYGVRSYGVVTIRQSTEKKGGKAIKNTRIGSTNGYLFGAGGLVGMYNSFEDNSSRMDTCFIVQDVTIDHLQINAASTNTTLRKYGIGGVVGNIWAYRVLIEGTKVVNSTIGTADLTAAPSNSTHAHIDFDDTTTGTNYRLPTGGMIGVPYAKYVHITDSTVENSRIETYSNQAGGFIGDCQVQVALEIGEVALTEVTSSDTTTYKCNTCGFTGFIRDCSDGVISKGNTIHSATQAAGGIIGTNTVGDNITWELSDITTDDCEIYSGLTLVDSDIKFTLLSDPGAAASSNCSAGGILGKTNRPIRALNLTNICVGNQSKIAGVHAGGMIGYVVEYDNRITLEEDIRIGYTKKITTTTTTENGVETTTKKVSYDQDTSQSVIYAYLNAGGLYGWNGTAGTEYSKADVQVYGLRIGSNCLNNSSSYYGTAGGVAGRRDLYNECKYDKLAIENCVIAANHGNEDDVNIACGGIFGMQKNGSNTAYIYAPRLKDNNIGYMDALKKPVDLKTNSLEKDDSKIRLLYTETTNTSKIRKAEKKWSELKSTADGINESTVGNYAIRIGNYIGLRGVDANASFYILHPDLEYSSSYTGSRPVIDVGNLRYANLTYNTALYGYGYPYAWQQYCHIVYIKDNENVSDLQNSVIDDSLLTTVNNTKANGYMFQQITNQGEYDSGKNGTDFLNMYKLNVRMDTYTLDGKTHNRTILGNNDDAYYYKAFDSHKLWDNVKKVITIDGIVPQTALDSFMGIMTNMGGVVKPSGTSVSNAILKVTAQKAVIDQNGKIYKYDKSQHTGASSDSASLTIVNSRYIQNTPYTYDEAIIGTGDTNNPQYYTITLLTYWYGWTAADGKTTLADVIYVPVYVKERVNFYSDLHIMEGEQYSLTDAHNDNLSYTSDNRNIKISHNSTYTLFAEMAYSITRKKDAFKDFKIDKVLTFEQNKGTTTNPVWGTTKLPTGLRLTLVDVETGIPYYYTVKDESGNTGYTTGKIPFTDFKKADGTSYQLRKIGPTESGSKVAVTDLNMTSTSYQYRNQTGMKGQEYGLEQYFIYVDSSQVSNMENLIYRIRIDTDGTSETTKNFVDRTQTDGIRINWAKGLDIGFYDKWDDRERESDGSLLHPDQTPVTNITGEISKDASLKIDTRIAITADSVYWNEKVTAGSTYIDSINNGKYLDVAVYLYDSDQNQVAFPASTTVKWNSTTVPAEQHTISQESVVYGYKNWGGDNYVFPVSQASGNVTESLTFRIPNTTTDVSNECHLELDFATADLDDYMGKKYTVVVELRRTSDADYPLGGDIVDRTSKTIDCVGSQEYAVALDVNDNMDLGINTYNESGYDHVIPFMTKLDFSSWIINDRETDIKACADKYYQVTYRLKKKVKKTVSTTNEAGETVTETVYDYVPIDNTAAEAARLNQDLTLYLANKEEDGTYTRAPEGLNLTYYNGEWVYQITKSFTESQIISGMGTDTKYIIGWHAVLAYNTKSLDLTDYSNYQLEVTILPYDKALSPEERPTTDKDEDDTTKFPSWSDFFIFTVAKLKTDM